MKEKNISELIQNRNWEKAIYEILLLPLPFDNEQLQALAWCYSRSEQYDKAIDCYKELIKREPNKAKGYYMVGYQYYAQKNWNAAIDYFNKALDIYPDYFIVKYRLSYAYIQLCGSINQCKKDEYWKAINHLENCHKIYENFGNEEKNTNKSTYADICVLHAKSIMMLSNYLEKSIKLLETANELKTDQNFQYELAKAYHRNKEFKKALSILPKVEKPYYISELKSLILTDSKDFKESNIILFKLIKYRKKDYLYRRIAKNYYCLNDYINAEKFINKAIVKDKNNYKNHLAAGYILKASKKFNLAISELELAISTKKNKYATNCEEALNMIKRIQEDTNNNLIKIDIEEPNTASYKEGIITKYFDKKGYGFIENTNNKSAIFFHVSNCKNFRVEVGIKVRYKESVNSKGTNAISIESIK